MVTKYSGRTGSVGGRTKLVLTYSPTSVKNSTSSVKVTAKFYYESKYRTQDSFNTGKLSGSLGSWSGGFSINGTSKLIKTITKTVSTSYSGSKKITVTGTLQTIEASPGAHKVTASITIPKRPVAKPNTPSNVNMSLLSDNRTKTTWSHSTSTARPVSSYTVQYERLDGSSWTGWKHSATVKGKSYTSNPGANNKSYRRRVRANNSAGSSSWAYSNYVRMQPYAPVNVRAKVQPSGSAIKVTWDFNNPAETTCFKLQLQRRVNGGSWANVSSSFGQVKSKPYTSSYTDTTPGSGSNQYRIRILNDCEGDDSVWSESNTVSTIVPPKAPTNLSPDGNVVDFTGDVLFTWQHHDAGDGADQTHYDLRYRAQGESAWTYAPAGGNESEKSEHLFESGELENGVNYEWQVRTQGNTKEGFGPWSKSAFVTGWTAPVVAIKDGAPPNPLTVLPVPLAWTYSQDEGQGQIEWQARLYALGSGDVFDSILEEKRAESSSTATEFSTALADGSRYGVMVRARSSQGQWSEWSETTFDVELLVPAELRVDLDYGEDTGQMNLNITSDEAVQGETAEVVSIDVQRRINGGEWVPIMVGIPFDSETTLVDNIPSIWGVNEYRVTATTEAPSKGVFGPFRKTVTPYIGNTENWLFLNYGETFDYMLRMQGDLSMSGSYDRSKETQKLLGRKKPISLLGQQLSREHQVTGTVEFHDECETPEVPDVPAELVGSVFFDDARAWNFSKVQAGPDSQVTADAHYRAKRYGYLLDVVEGNTENLVSPSPRSGVPGSEVPGREVEEVTARNLVLNPLGDSATSDQHWRSSPDEVKEFIPDDGGSPALEVRDEVGGGMVYSDPNQSFTADEDQWIAYAVDVKALDPERAEAMKLSIRSYSGMGLTDFDSGATGRVRTDEYVRMWRVARVSEVSEEGYARALVWPTDVETPGGFRVRRAAVAVADEKDTALSSVMPFFDGEGTVHSDDLVRVNEIVNGSFSAGMTGWQVDGGTGQATSSFKDQMWGGSSHKNLLVQIVADGTQQYLGFRADESNYQDVAPGQYVAYAALLANDGTGVTGTRGEIYFYGDKTTSVFNGRQSSGFYAGRLETIVAQVPEGANQAQFRVSQWSGNSDTPVPEGSRVWVGDVRGCVADSEEAALAGVERFAEGGMDRNGPTYYRYLGEEGASASAEYRQADVSNVNYLPPLPEWDVSGVSASQSDDGWFTVNTTTTSTTYWSTPSPWTTTVPVNSDLRSASVDLRVDPEDRPVNVRLRVMVYGGRDSLQDDYGVETHLIPNDGEGHRVTVDVPDLSTNRYLLGVRVLLYIRDEDNNYTEGNRVDVRRAYLGDGEPFDSSTPDTFDRLYREAPDGTSLELVTDSQSLYRWTGAEAASESEKYLPAAPEHFDEYSEWLDVEPGGTYQVEAFVKAPDLRSVARRNLTSQGQFVTNRKLWGSSEVSGSAARWTEESMFENGAISLAAKRTGGLVITPTAYLATGAKASTLGIETLSGTALTIAADVYAEEAPNEDQRIYIRALDSAGDMIGDALEHAFRATDEVERYVMRVTLPEGTESFDLRFAQNATNTTVYASNFTVEAGDTDGSWIDESAGREWLGAENIDAVQLMVEEFAADGESLRVETVAELTPENFSNRWRTIAGEYTVGLGAATVRTWVEWVVNGDHPELQSDWYLGGMKATNVYVVPERWPGPDSNPDEWRIAQYESTTVCLRTPSGHRVFGAMSGLDINAVEGSLDLAEVSFTVTETDYTENPVVIDESDIWDNIVVDAQNDQFEVQPGFGNIVLNPYSGSEA